MKKSRRKAAPVDYDTNPERFRMGSELPWNYGVGGVHEAVAERIATETLAPLLDVGCGEGRLLSRLNDREMRVIALDSSPTMLSAVAGERVHGDACALPFADGVFGSVAALYMLYHLDNARAAIAEGYRVLRRGGLFVAATPSRFNDPELGRVLPPDPPSTFDAEITPALIGEMFDIVEVERWDAPLIHLPDLDAVATYLFARGLAARECTQAARRVGAPLTLTKRWCLVYAWKTST